MDFILRGFGQYKIKRNVKLFDVLVLLKAKYFEKSIKRGSGDWDICGNGCENLIQHLKRRKYISMDLDRWDTLVIKHGEDGFDNNVVEIKTEIFKDQLERMIAGRIIRENLL